MAENYSATFEFRSEKTWTRVWEALNDTYYNFASYGYKAITVFTEEAAELLRASCKAAKIKYKEI